MFCILCWDNSTAVGVAYRDYTWILWLIVVCLSTRRFIVSPSSHIAGFLTPSGGYKGEKESLRTSFRLRDKITETRSASKRGMYSELECGICYLTYNAARRCPRELHCKHTFCESCLLALSRSQTVTEATPNHAPDRSIVCPLCRHTTSLSDEAKIRAELRVDEGAMERLMVTGVLLERDDDEEPEEPVEEETHSQSSAEDSDSSEGVNRSRLRRTFRKVWKKISGKSTVQPESDSAGWYL